MSKKLELTDTVVKAIAALAQGDTGATSVLLQVVSKGNDIDPDGGYATAFAQIDDLDLYGRDIWTLYQDVCGKDLIKTLAVIRGVKLGVATRKQVAQAITGHQRIDAAEVLKQVQTRLPRFGRTESPKQLGAAVEQTSGDQ